MRNRAIYLSQNHYRELLPRGPKDQKNVEISSGIEKIRARMKFSSKQPTEALVLWVNRDVEIEIFERD